MTFRPSLTRRRFLQRSAPSTSALVLANPVLRSLSDSLVRLGVPVPWYHKGQVRTTYNYCGILRM
jgi:hypothetical protein